MSQEYVEYRTNLINSINKYKKDHNITDIENNEDLVNKIRYGNLLFKNDICDVLMNDDKFPYLIILTNVYIKCEEDYCEFSHHNLSIYLKKI